MPLSRRVLLLGALAAGCGPAPRPAPAPAPTATAGAPAPAAPGPAATPAPAAPGGLAYPVARRGEVVETLHGEKVADPYRWLEDLGSAETKAWLAAERAVTQQWFAGVPSRDRIARELLAAVDYERILPPRRRGTKWFYTRNAGKQDQPVLYVADAPTGEGKVVADFNKISPDGKLGFAGLSISPRGTYIAYGLSLGGADWVEWRVREVATGKDLPDRVEWTKYYDVAWTADERAFYYSRFPKPEAGKEVTARDLGCTVRRHALGTDPSADPIVHERPDHPTWQFELDVTEDGRWLVITTGDGQVGDRALEELHVLDLAAGPKAKLAPLVEGFDAEYVYIASEGSTFFVKSTQGAPKGKVIAIDAKNPARTAWRTIVPEGEGAIQGVARSGNRLAIATLVDASTRLATVGLDGKQPTEIPLPGAGSARVMSMPRDEKALYFAYTSFDAPLTTYRIDPATGKREALRPPRMVIDPSGFEAKKVFYAGKDGTRIPMFVVHKKGLVLDGKNPTYLTGYGGFVVSITPRYSPIDAWWLSTGGVLAMPALRGGGEYGEAWAKAAEKTKKQVTFDDFIAAAEWLIAQRYTSPAKLAISGASNGGLLVGAAVTQRPDLFGAVVVKVGVLDMLRFHLVGQGEGWTGAYGSPTVPEEFRALRAYSPVHNVKPGTKYPAILVVTGENDTRVAPWHSFKFTAALQAAQAGPAPNLLYLESVSGHGGGTTLSAAIANEADIYAFLRKSLDAPLP